MANPNHDDAGKFSSGGGLRGQIKQAMSYSDAKAQKQKLEEEHEKHGKVLKALSGGGPMGLTPDSVRATPQWQEASRNYEKAHTALREFNGNFTKTYAKEYAAERPARLAAMRDRK